MRAAHGFARQQEQQVVVHLLAARIALLRFGAGFENHRVQFAPRPGPGQGERISPRGGRRGLGGRGEGAGGSCLGASKGGRGEGGKGGTGASLDSMCSTLSPFLPFSCSPSAGSASSMT